MKRSFTVHAERVEQNRLAHPPIPIEFEGDGEERLLDAIAQKFRPIGELPRGFSKEGALLYLDPTVFDNALIHSKQDASPGFPWVCMGCQFVSDVVAMWRAWAVAVCIIRVVIWFVEGGEPESVDAWERGWRDPVRVFIKGEPHNEKKIAAERWRLIMNSGLCDVLVDRWLFGPQMTTTVVWQRTLPIKPGMGLDDIGLLKLMWWFKKCMSESPTGIQGSDVSMWDWSVLQRVARLAWRLQCRLQGVPEDSDLARLQWIAVLLKFRKVISMGRGGVYAQECRYSWESGSYITALFNSYMRIVVAYLVACEVRDGKHVWSGFPYATPSSMGDDAVEDRAIELERYWRYMLKAEADGLAEGDVEFCSTFFPHDGSWPWPTSWPRTLYRYITLAGPDARLQLEYDLRHWPRLQQLRSWLDLNPHVQGRVSAPEEPSEVEIGWPAEIF